MHPSLQRAGAAAAVFLALSYVLSFALAATLFSSGGAPAERLDFLLSLRRPFEAWLLLYPLSGLALGLLTQSMHERLAARAPAWMRLATPMGWIWAALLMLSGMVGILGLEAVGAVRASDPVQARSAWLAISVVQEALGGGIELVGGVWVLLIGAAAWQAGVWGRGRLAFGALVGVAGVLSAWPPLFEIVALFGLGQIPWFLLVAGALRSAPAQGLRRADAAA